MGPSKRLFDKCGGYRKLHSFTFATLIHLGTIKFCKRFIPWKEDPLGKIAGQMIGAARSGRQNIIEGSERSATGSIFSVLSWNSTYGLNLKTIRSWQMQ